MMHDIAKGADGLPVSLHMKRPARESVLDRFVDQYRAFISPLLCLLLALAAWIMGEHTPAGTQMALAAVALAGFPILRNSVISTITNKKLNAEVLVAIALVASVWVGEYVAGAMVALMMNIGELLEDLTIARTGRAIRSLMDLTPQRARILRDGQPVEVDIDTVRVGDIAVVRPGEKIPVDGTIVQGRGEVDQAPITGESMPVTKEPGDPVFGGTINRLGALRIEVSKIGQETTLSRIIHLVQKAQAEKPPIERIADRFAAWFTPVMLALAALVWGITGEVLRAVTILVVACPCAMVIATPTAVVAGIGNAARKGILVKGGDVLETVSRLTVFAFDKTGTLTYGKPMASMIRPFEGSSSHDVLTLAATAETSSGHPLAQAVLDKAREEALAIDSPDDTQVVVGRGVRARKKNREILVGNPTLFKEEEISLSAEAQTFIEETVADGITGVLVAEDGKLVGGIGIVDTVKPEVATAVSDLRTLGINKIIMLTGDDHNVARSAVAGAGMDEIVAGLMPDQKSDYIDRLRLSGETVAMVGDGINDAPALVKADVGIAMGSAGTDTAIEASDIALTTDDLSRVCEAIALSRQTIKVIKQSIVISIGINVLALILAGTGDIGPVVGAFIHNIGSVIVVGNSSRLIGYRFTLTAGKS